VIATKTLEQVGFIHETIKLKGGCWDDSGVLLYSTLNHLKFSLPNGDNGIIKTLDVPLYPIKLVAPNQVLCLDREANVKVIPFDPTEYRFKLALVQKDYDQVLQIIRTSNLVGQSVIGYLEKKGYPEVALQFVKDPKTRFELALECGNLGVGLETAKVIDKEHVWTQLGEEALLQGNHQVSLGGFPFL
jgi:coatomer protein complex subunit alpha (xenin)